MLTLIAAFLIAVLLIYLVQLLPLDGRIVTALQIVIILAAVLFIVDAMGLH